MIIFIIIVKLYMDGYENFGILKLLWKIIKIGRIKREIIRYILDVNFVSFTLNCKGW